VEDLGRIPLELEDEDPSDLAEDFGR